MILNFMPPTPFLSPRLQLHDEPERIRSTLAFQFPTVHAPEKPVPFLRAEIMNQLAKLFPY